MLIKYAPKEKLSDKNLIFKIVNKAIEVNKNFEVISYLLNKFPEILEFKNN